MVLISPAGIGQVLRLSLLFLLAELGRKFPGRRALFSISGLPPYGTDQPNP